MLTTVESARLSDGMTGIALLAGGANVIMQLGRLPVGHGVVHSPVESGNLFKHPVKRTRTTLMFLVMAMEGTPDELRALRAEITRVHARVKSGPDSKVQYRALDPELQLWVAACIYRGVEDTYRVLWGDLDEQTHDDLYWEARRFGTTLQVREEQWPENRKAFQEYWDREVRKVEMDDETRAYLQAIARAEFLPRPLQWLLGRFTLFTTMGFLYPEFRAELRLPWTEADQRKFDRFLVRIGKVNRRMPRILREFPFNLIRWDTRRRLRAGRPVL